MDIGCSGGSTKPTFFGLPEVQNHFVVVVVFFPGILFSIPSCNFLRLFAIPELIIMKRVSHCWCLGEQKEESCDLTQNLMN